MNNNLELLFVIVVIIALSIFWGVTGYNDGKQNGFCSGVATALEATDFVVKNDECFITLDQGESWTLYLYEDRLLEE